MEMAQEEQRWLAWVEALGSKEPLARQAAGQAMAQMGEHALPWLLSSLRDKRSSTRRREAAVVLGSRGTWFRAAVPALIEGLKDKSVGVRREALCALEQMRAEAKEAVSSICQLLRKDGSVQVRTQAARSLGGIRCATHEAVASLVEALLRDPAEQVRCGSALALGYLGETDVALAALVEALHDEDEGVRHQVLLSLGTLGAGSVELIPAVMRSFQEDSSILRGAAVTALWKIGIVPREEIGVVLVALRNADHAVRSWAAWALGQAGETSPLVFRALCQALSDIWWGVRSRAAEALGGWGEKAQEATSLLASCFEDEHPLVRRDAVLALGKIGKGAKTSIPSIFQLMTDTHSGVRRAALQALMYLVDQEDVAFLLSQLKKADRFVRQAAARGLGWSGCASEEVISALRLSLGEEDIRWWSALALVQLGKLWPTEMGILLESWTEILMRWEEYPSGDFVYEMEPWVLGAYALRKNLESLQGKTEALSLDSLERDENKSDPRQTWWAWQRDVGPFVLALYERLCGLRGHWEDLARQSEWSGDARRFRSYIEDTKEVEEAMQSLVLAFSHEKMQRYAKEAEDVLF